MAYCEHYCDQRLPFEFQWVRRPNSSFGWTQHVHLRFESKHWQLESPKEKVSRFYRPRAENQASYYCWQQPTGKRLTAAYYAQHYGRKLIEP